MNGNGDLYAHLRPQERMTLVLEALARKDEGEADRLTGSCPRRTYTMRDAAYGDRVSAAFDIMAIACIDLRCLAGKLSILQWAADGMRLMATHHQITATFALMDGQRLGQGLPQLSFFQRSPALPPDETPEPSEGPDEPEDTSQRFAEYHAGDLGTRMMAVEDRVQAMTDLTFGAFNTAANQLAQELADLWAAFDRFCLSRIGASAVTLLSAWEFPTGAEVTDILKDCPDVTPDPMTVERYFGMYCQAWDRQFGDGR